MTTTNIYLITAFISALILNMFFRYKFEWWKLLLFATVFNLFTGVLIFYIIISSGHNKVYFNITEDNLAAYFGESFGSTLISFLIIAPLFRNKKKKVDVNEPTWVVQKKYSLDLLSQFKKLPKGVYRLLIVGWLLLPLIVSFISASLVRYNGDEIFLVTLIFGIPIYYILVRFGIWIYLGFREDAKK